MSESEERERESMEEATMAAKMEWLSCIDSSTLSQSELHALSLSSFSTFDLTSTTNLVNPKIDHSTFNESAGSHRQTYSKLRPRPRVAAFLPAPSLSPDHRLIIDYLKQFIREDPKFDQVELIQPQVPSPPARFDVGGEIDRKRKRGRKPKVKVHLDECYRGMEIVNKNGVAVDMTALGYVEAPFSEELKRRTEGMRGEEELLGFLSNLGGQWGSRRKKRRIVDAADFGDVLPLGWKLLLALKRKDGHAWIYCRRYISPNGQQFVSCKEVSSYLQSIFGNYDVQHQISGRSENTLQEQRVATENSAGVTCEEQDQQDHRQIVATNSDVSGLSVSNERLKEVAMLEMDNLADVKIRDLFECHKCNMTFDEKDLYLQHLLSIHQKTTRRYRIGSSVGDGVIIKDGKFECQFCHKVFLERHRYNGHVGIHVRNYVRRAEDLPGQPNVQRPDTSPVREEIPSKISKMDALIEIAQNSIMEEDSVIEPYSSSELNMVPVSETAVGDLDRDTNSEWQMEDSLNGTNVVCNLNQQDSPSLPMDGEVDEIDDGNQVIDAKMFTFLDNNEGKDDLPLTVEGFDQSGIDLVGVSQIPLLPSPGYPMVPEFEKSGHSDCINTKGNFKPDEDNGNKSELKIGLNDCKEVVPIVANVQVTVMPASKEDVIQSRVSNPSVSPEQSLDCISAFSSDKGGKQFCNVDHGHDNVEVFQELRLDDIGSLEHDFASVQGSLDVPSEVANNIVMEGKYASSAQSESQEVMLDVDDRNQLTTLCVWCGIEFNHDAVNFEIQPDSVGFMCPACKANISGQINVLDSGSPNAGHL